MKCSIAQNRFKQALALAGLSMAFAVGSRTVSADPVLPTLPFTGLTLVQEIDCSQTPGVPFAEFPTAGTSQVQTILGQQARTMSNPAGSPVKYFAYRVGQGLGLQAGKAYVLEVDYPEDQSRSMVICNWGEASARGLHTGKTVGDALTPPYVTNNAESANIPLAGAWRTWRSLFHLHDRFSDLQRLRSDQVRPMLPADGFWVAIVQYANDDEPLSQGAAVGKIRLYEAPPQATYDANLQLPPTGLPRRQLFVREEMADSVAGLGATDLTMRGVTTTVNYYEYKAREMKFLGMNTFCKDLLEFGGNQGWDSVPGGGNNWYYSAKEPQLWEQILTMLGSYSLDVLPYYEYAGSEGAQGLGGERRAKPLNANLSAYTQISWAESTRADLADPETLDDARLLLDVTMSRFRNKVNFLGAWFRNRVSQMPVSFSDNDFAWYAQERRNGEPFTRAQVQTTKSLYDDYVGWWYGKRRDFVTSMRDHLRSEGIRHDAAVLFTSDASEPGRSPGVDPELVAEDTTAWSSLTPAIPSVDPATALAQGRHRKAMTTARSTYSGWEWQHADPYNDPANYASLEGAMLTYTFNKPYTLAEDALVNEFKTQSGTAMIRHHALNENVLDDPATTPVEEPLGYFVADMERTGAYCMMGEAVAFAKGDARYIGYLAANTFSPGFPEYRRAFNQAFLALPAVPGTIRGGASSNSNVVARDYPTDGYGTYMGIVNTSTANQNTVTVTFPYRAQVTDAATGTVLSAAATSIVLDMYPFQLRALRLDKRSTTGAVAEDDSVTLGEGTTVDVDVIANDSGPGTLTVSSVGAAEHGSVSIVSNRAHYVPAPGFFGTDSFRYTVGNGTDTDSARVYVTVTNTALAQNLDSWGIKDRNIGADDTGHTRLLADGITGEVVGFGAGTSTNSDNGHYVNRTVSGDFQATIKLNGVSGSGDAMAGLMLRQTDAPTDRMVAALVDPSGALHAISRATASAASAGATVAASGASWVRLKRAGDIVTIEKSSNGTTFTECAWRSIPGLPATVRIGLWASGGDRYSGSRALVQSLSVAPTNTGELFLQDFTSSTSVPSYVDAAGAFGTFKDIGREANAGLWEIDSEGALKLNGTTLADPNDAGFTRTTPLTPLGSVLKVSMRVGISGLDTYSDFGFLDFGNFTTVLDYGNSTPNANLFAQIGLRGAGYGDFRFKINGLFYGDFLADGRLYQFTIYLSQSASAQTYTGPDGLMHTLDAGKASLWVDSAPVLENWTRDPLFTASAPSTFKLRSTSGLNATIRMDDFVVENRFSASTPTHTNSNPTAVNDAASTPESVPATIDVLANDTDSDAGPQGLTITGVSGAIGSATVVDGKIVYTPTPGFYGSNTLTYTISDGAGSSTGSVVVTVNSTSTASNLASASLTGASMGAGSTGGSRVLSDGYWEVKHLGGGGTPASDALWWEQKSVSGNFQTEFRVRDLLSNGSGAIGGILLREGTGAGARMIELGVDPSAVARIYSRSVVGAAVVQSPQSAQMAFPAAWLQLERFGDTVTTRVSADGLNFTILDTVTIPGLAQQLQTGLFAAQARMSGTGFIVRPYLRAFVSANFDTSTSLSSYFRELDPESNQFSDISAESLGGAWSIDTGRLKIVRGTGTGSPSGAGFMRTTDLPGPPGLVRLSFDLTLANVNTTSDLMLFEFGNFPTVADYNDNIVSASVNIRFSIRGRGNGKYTVRLNSVNAADFTVPATAIPLMVWVNNVNGPAVNYRAPDGVVRQLDYNRVSIWMGGSTGAMLFNNATKETSLTSPTVKNFRMRMSGQSFTAMFDNFVVDDDFLPNASPTAVNDSASTNEGVSKDVNVLVNDTDADAGPQALSITGVSNGTGGTASVVGGQVRYVPAPGFFGSDALTYTITDGAMVSWAQVQMTVNNTSLAPNLTSAGLAGTSIGTGSSGSSRILSDARWEIRGIGNGLGGTADSYRGELKSISGDFEMAVKISETQLASGGKVGLVAREGTGSGDRMIAISLGADQVVRYATRTTTGASASETAIAGTYSPGSTWLLLKRVGSNLSASVSTNGSTFTEVVNQSYASLTGNLQAGLWVTGGSGSYNGRGVFAEFDLDQGVVAFSQAFDTFTTAPILANYINATINPTQFNDVSAEPAGSGIVGGGTWSVESVNDYGSHYDGKVKLVRAASPSAGGTNGAGFTRYNLSTAAPTKAVLRFKVSVSGINTSQEIGVVEVGAFTGFTDYNATTPTPGVSNRLSIKGGGNGLFRFSLNAINATTLSANGTEVQVDWYMNHTAASINYVGPDGSAQTLGSGKCDLWVNNSRQFDESDRSTSFGTGIASALKFRTGTDQPMTIKFDNIELRELP